MSKFAKWSTFKQVYNTYYSRLVYNRRVRASIKAKSQQYLAKVSEEPSVKLPITKTIFEGFEDHSCLARWGEVTDKEFGGSSEATLSFNSILGLAILKGKINTQLQQKLETYPFIGMIQKLPFVFKIGIFNCLRVQLIGDGHPILCEVGLQSYEWGQKIGKATLFTSKDEKLTTYQLPFRNFHLGLQQISNPFNTALQVKQTMANIIDVQRQCQISSISFRLLSKNNVERKVEFKKIELVRAKRGASQNSQYRKPYFYIVDQSIEEDKLLEKINIGAYEIVRSR